MDRIHVRHTSEVLAILVIALQAIPKEEKRAILNGELAVAAWGA
jgi:hypothetical protein